MPGYYRAELSAELTVVPSWESGNAPRDQIEAANQAASDSGLAHESGPGSTVLAGSQKEVLEAMMEVVKASLDAGVHIVQIKVEAEWDSPRFGERS
ncbi:MAG: thiamine-binding protein [Rubrobacteraceae bacterium]